MILHVPDETDTVLFDYKLYV